MEQFDPALRINNTHTEVLESNAVSQPIIQPAAADPSPGLAVSFCGNEDRKAAEDPQALRASGLFAL